MLDLCVLPAAPETSWLSQADIEATFQRITVHKVGAFSSRDCERPLLILPHTAGRPWAPDSGRERRGAEEYLRRACSCRLLLPAVCACLTAAAARAGQPDGAVRLPHPPGGQPGTEHGQGLGPHGVNCCRLSAWCLGQAADALHLLQNDLEFVRIRSKVHEIMVAPRAPQAVAASCSLRLSANAAVLLHRRRLCLDSHPGPQRHRLSRTIRETAGSIESWVASSCWKAPLRTRSWSL